MTTKSYKRPTPLIGFFKDNLGILAAFLLICIIIAILSPVFGTADNFFTLGRQISTNAMIALGMALSIILGGIDLSVGAIVALSGTLCVGLINTGVPYAGGMLIGIGIGAAAGFANGVIISKTRMAPFIVTMSMMSIVRGGAYIYSGGLPIRCTDDAFASIGTGYVGMVPLPLIYLVIAIIFISLLLSRTKFGSYIYAIGGNRDAAKFSGVPMVKVETIVYTLAGFLSGFAGVVLAARMFSGQPSVSQGAELDAIAACVLGGVSMAGGTGKIGGVVIGSLIIGVISNGLNLLNINSFWQLIAKGVIVLIAVYLDLLKKERSMRSK